MLSRRQLLFSSCAVVAGCVMPRWALAEDKEFVGKAVFDRLMARSRKDHWAKLPMGVLLGTIGMALRDTPYAGHTIDLYDERETCAINLEGVDCATLYEAALALARTLKLGGHSQGDFVRQVRLIRYRGGKMDGYLSRLHYASDYFFDNERKGIVKVITADLPGAEVFQHPVGYMSKHPEAYRQLKSHPELLPRIARMEAEINSRRTYFLPKEKIAAAEPLLQTGDILGLTTRRAGLDCSHTGLAFRDQAGALRFLHASSKVMKVTLGDELSKFLEAAKSDTGIMVARPV